MSSLFTLMPLATKKSGLSIFAIADVNSLRLLFCLGLLDFDFDLIFHNIYDGSIRNLQQKIDSEEIAYLALRAKFDNFGPKGRFAISSTI